MAKTWYPVIDYSVCVDCGTCVEHCGHGVYDKSKAPSSVVVCPDGCVDRCHGCGNKCPTGAISYVGDDTGWVSPNGKQENAESCCSHGDGESAKKEVSVEYLYLDLETCDRCIGTDKVLEEVLLVLAPALQLAGYKVEFNKIEMETADIAKKYKFLSSPTIRVNRCDIFENVKENNWGCCSEISGSDVDCRVFEYEGAAYEVPPKEMLAEAILKAVFCISRSDDTIDYKLQDNLTAFFAGKNNKLACSCSGNCC